MQPPLQSYRWDEATYSKTVLAENIFDYENIISAYIVLEYVASKGVYARINTRPL